MTSTASPWHCPPRLDLSEALRKAVEDFKNMTPEQQAVEIEKQRASYARSLIQEVPNAKT